MKDLEEVEKASFLKCGEEKAGDENSRVGRAAEKEHYYKIGPDKALLIEIGDFLINTTVVSVNTIAFWRGLFGIFSELHGPYILFSLYLFGSLIHVHFSVSRSAYKKYLEKKTVCNVLLRKAYTYVFGSACVMQWASLWYMLDEISGLDAYPPLVYSVVCSLVLVCFRVFRTLLAPPFVLSTDRLDEFFDFQTAFRTTLSKKGSCDISLYVLDSFFSVFVIGSLVVFVWRGVWCLTDIFLYPGNDKYSAFGSLAIGYGLAVIIFSLQIPMEKLSESLTGFWRILVVDIYIFVSFIGTIHLWRGVWNLLNIYFLPEFPILSCWLTHLGSFAILVLMNCSNSILVRGVYLDGEGEKCGVFPISYLRLIFEDRLKKKAEKAEMNHKINSLTNVCAEDVEKGQKENSDTFKGPLQNSDEIKS